MIRGWRLRPHAALYWANHASGKPLLDKVTVTMGINQELQEGTKNILTPVAHLALLTGQQPKVRAARMSVAQFHVREGSPTNLQVTLRGSSMYNFLERTIFTALPRLPAFAGLDPRAGFDGNGNFSMGIAEMTAFPDMPETAKRHGLLITINTGGQTDAEALRILTMLGVPFKPRRTGGGAPQLEDGAVQWLSHLATSTKAGAKAKASTGTS